MPTKPSRLSALDDIGDPDAPPGSKAWAKWMIGQAKLRRQDLQRDVTGLQEIIRKLERHAAWKPLGFMSLGMLCTAELDLDDKEVDLIRQAKEGTTLGVVLGKHGGDRKSEGARNQVANSDSFSGCSTTNTRYLRARLDRDHKEIAQALARGEYPSARAAGIAAGIVKVPTAIDLGRRAWFKMTQDQRSEFLAWLYTPEANPAE